MPDDIFKPTHLTKSNEKWLIIEIISENFEKLKNKAIWIRNNSHNLWDYSIASNENPNLSIYWFYSEFVVWKLFWIYNNFDTFLDNLDINKWLDWGKDIILNNEKVIQVKFTEYFSKNEWKHIWDIMNQFDRQLTSDYYILVTKWDEYKKNSLRIVWWTDKEHFSLQDDNQINNWFIKKRQRKINRCTIQTNLFNIEDLELNLWIKFNLTWFTIIN